MRWGTTTKMLLSLALGCGFACNPSQIKRATAVIALESLPLTLDPRIALDQAAQRTLILTHQGLLKRDEHLELVPDGCISWRWVEPYRELVFDFPAEPDHSAHWYAYPNGHALRAEDALASIQALRDPALRSAKAGPFREEIRELALRKMGSRVELHIQLKAPNPGFASNLVQGVLGITERGECADPCPGSGPYQLVTRTAERLRLEPRPQHPDLHAGALPIELALVPDAAGRVLALRHGSADLAPNNIPADLLAAAPGMERWTHPGANLEYIAFRCTHPILKDARVRRALSWSLDREAMVQGLHHGMARPAWTFFPPELPQGAPMPAEIPKDLSQRRQQAERWLDEAGWPRRAGKRFTLTLLSTPEAGTRMKALALQDQWHKVGVETRIDIMEFGTLLGRVLEGHFEVASLRWTGAVDPDMLTMAFHSRMAPPTGYNRGGFSDVETDRMLEAARLESDAVRRRVLLHQVQIRLEQQSPYACLWWIDQVVVARPGFSMAWNALGELAPIYPAPHHSP